MGSAFGHQGRAEFGDLRVTESSDFERLTCMPVDTNCCCRHRIRSARPPSFTPRALAQPTRSQGTFVHGAQEDRADRRRADRRHARPSGRPEGARRHRPVRHRRRRAAGQGARHRRVSPGRGLRRQASPAPTTMQAIAGADVVHRHRRRAAQARHEPRRSARHQPQGDGGGRRGHQAARARTPSSSASPTRSTPWSGRCRSSPACRQNKVVGMAGVLDSRPLPLLPGRGVRRLGRGRHGLRARRPRRRHGAARPLLHRRRHPAARPRQDGLDDAGEARRHRRAHPRRRRRDRRPAQDRLGLLRAGGLGDRDGRELPQGQEARPALRRLSRRPVRREGHVCRRARR